MILSLLVLALGLAMDAFAVAISQGAAFRPNPARVALIAGAFGLAQAIMPLAGWLPGIAFLSLIQSVDHWIALILLGFLGTRLAWEGLSRAEGDAPKPLTGWALLTASIATSIDAAVAGLTLPTLGAPIVLSCATIGIVTAVLCAGGVMLGKLASDRLGKPAEIIGGIMLIGLGVRIFIEHQFLGG